MLIYKHCKNNVVETKVDYNKCCKNKCCQSNVGTNVLRTNIVRSNVAWTSAILITNLVGPNALE